MTRPTIAFALALTFFASPALAEFPRSGVEAVPNGVAEPFVGNWSMGFPVTAETIVAETIYTCDSPVVLTRVDDTTIHYASPKGGDVNFELGAFEGRTPWYPPQGSNSIAVWTSEDSFNLHSVGPTGSADWDNPYELVRCP